MNRPKKENYLMDGRFMSDFYSFALDNYIDELEEALDNACDMLETYDLANNELTRPKHSKEEWKEWAFKR